jgi:hypothetical protein
MRRVAGETRVTKACAYATGEHIHARSFSRLAEIAISVWGDNVLGVRRVGHLSAGSSPTVREGFVCC